MSIEDEIKEHGDNYDWEALNAYVKRSQELTSEQLQVLADVYEGHAEQTLMDVASYKMDQKGGYSHALHCLRKLVAVQPQRCVDDLRAQCYSGLAEIENTPENLQRAINLNERYIASESDRVQALAALAVDRFSLMAYHGEFDAQGLEAVFAAFKQSVQEALSDFDEHLWDMNTSISHWRECLWDLPRQADADRQAWLEDYHSFLQARAQEDARLFSRWGIAILRLWEHRDTDAQLLQEAKQILRQGADATYTQVEHFVGYGQALIKVGDLESDAQFFALALQTFERALALDPSYTFSAMYAANALRELARLAQQSDPEQSYAHYAKACTYFRERREQLADNFSMNLDFAELLFECAESGAPHDKQARLQEAHAQYQYVLDQHPDYNFKPYQGLARVALRQGDAQAALRLLATGLERFSPHPPVDSVLEDGVLSELFGHSAFKRLLSKHQ